MNENDITPKQYGQPLSPIPGPSNEFILEHGFKTLNSARKPGSGNPFISQINKLRAIAFMKCDEKTMGNIVNTIIRKAEHQTHPDQLKAAHLLFSVLGLLVKRIEAEVKNDNASPEELRSKVAAFFGLRTDDLIGKLTEVGVEPEPQN